MGSDDIFKKRRSSAEKNYKRRTSFRDPRERLLIVCEGSKTEPRYFEGFRLTNVKVVGTGYNTDSLVQYAIQLKRNAERLLSQYPDIDPVNNNPSTTIHVLVKELNKWVW